MQIRLYETLFNAIVFIWILIDHTFYPPLIIDAIEENNDDDNVDALIDWKIDPTLNKLSPGKNLKRKRKIKD